MESISNWSPWMWLWLALMVAVVIFNIWMLVKIFRTHRQMKQAEREHQIEMKRLGALLNGDLDEIIKALGEADDPRP